MVRCHFFTILSFLLIFLPVTTHSQAALSVETGIIWETYVSESPRDQKTKDFLAPRINTFINNLRQLQKQLAESGAAPVRLEISETANRLKRDYQMLEATIRNLKMLSGETEGARTADLELLASLGRIYGQARTLANR